MTTQEIKVLEQEEANILRELIAAEGKLEKYKDDNRLEFINTDFFTLNPKQQDLVDAFAERAFKVFTYTGGNRTGKTTIGVILAFSIMFGEYLWNQEKIWFPHRYPRRVRLVAGDWEKSVMQVVTPELHFWWPKRRPVKIKKNNVGAEAYWTDLATGSTLEIMSNNQESILHEGWKGDFVLYDEPPKRDIRVANARGLVDRLGKELFSMTLLKEAWVDTEVINAVDEIGKPDKTVYNVHAEIYDNVGYGITMEGIEQYAKTLDEDEKEARLKGIPSYKSGLIYKDYKRKYKDKGGHIVEPFKVPLNWMVDIAFDFHPRKQQAVLFVATNERNERYIIDEIWDYGSGTRIAEDVVRKVLYNGYRVNRVVIDPLSKGDPNSDDEGESTFWKVAKVLARYDMLLETASKDKDAGILAVRDHLKGPNNEPSLWIFDTCVRTLHEIGAYMWDKDTQKPQKENDDMMENLYRIALLNTQYEPPNAVNYEQEDDSEQSNTKYAVY